LRRFTTIQRSRSLNRVTIHEFSLAPGHDAVCLPCALPQPSARAVAPASILGRRRGTDPQRSGLNARARRSSHFSPRPSTSPSLAIRSTGSRLRAASGRGREQPAMGGGVRGAGRPPGRARLASGHRGSGRRAPARAPDQTPSVALGRRRPRQDWHFMSTSLQLDASRGYLNCPRCGLSIALRPHRTAIRHCPRCVARSREIVELFISTLAVDALYAADSRPHAGVDLSQPVGSQ
jgi:hypothetical protein